MKKTSLKLALVTVLIATMLSGCTLISGLFGGAGFDPEVVVADELNSFYLNIHSEEYVESFNEPVTIEELEERYADNIAVEAEWIATYLGADPSILDTETFDRLVAVTTEISSKIKFEVIGAEQTGDDYIVTVSVEPIDVITNTFTDEFFEEYSEFSLNDPEMLAMDDVAFTNAAMNDFIDTLEEAMATLGYRDAVEVEIGIDVSDEGYEVLYSDIEDGFHLNTIEYNF